MPTSTQTFKEKLEILYNSNPLNKILEKFDKCKKVIINNIKHTNMVYIFKSLEYNHDNQLFTIVLDSYDVLTNVYVSFIKLTITSFYTDDNMIYITPVPSDEEKTLYYSKNTN